MVYPRWLEEGGLDMETIGDYIDAIILNNQRIYHLLIRRRALVASYKSETDPKKKKNLKVTLNSLYLETEKLNHENNQLKANIRTKAAENSDYITQNFINLDSLRRASVTNED